MAHKLLLADDSVTIQRVIELTFADEDVQVTTVGDGRQAIEQIMRDRPDIILADIGMPERDGYDVAAFIKADADLKHIPILLLTGAFEPVDEARAAAVGCDGVLVKPFEPQMVISRVKDLLATRKPASVFAGTAHPPPSESPPSVHGAATVEQGSVTSSAPASGSLEEYFDRLDAAFATFESGQPSAAAVVEPPAAVPVSVHPAASPAAERPATEAFAAEDELAEWKDIGDELTRSAADETAAPAATEWLPSAGPNPTLAEAFAALLAAERGQAVSPVDLPPQPLPAHVVEDIVAQVVSRMTDQIVREVVLDVAERLVRDEIRRIANR